MDQIQLAIGDVLLIFAGGVVETFHRSYDRSFRTPAAWLAVRAQPAKHDSVQFTIGRTDQETQPIYGPDVSLSWTDIRFDLDSSDEPHVREFFNQVAQASGRS